MSDEHPPSLIEIIEDVQRQEHLTSRPHYFRPSMLFGCKRANVFHYTHSPENVQYIDFPLLRILDTGTALHSMIQDKYLANHYDYWFVKEARVRRTVGGALIIGSTDGTMIRRRDLYRWGVEIKTTGDKKFMSLAGPLDGHRLQASVYCRLQGLKYITVIYFNRDRSLFREYVVEARDEDWRDVKRHVKHLKLWADRFMEEKVPRNLPKYDEETCDPLFCRYSKYCKRMGAPIILATA